MKSNLRLVAATLLVLPCAVLAAGALQPSGSEALQPVTAAPSPAVAPVHCQVPCGIYGDKMRIDMLMEDAATIEKGMKMLQGMDKEESPSKNQMVRWVMNKDQHAQMIQDTVASYWLAQRVKAPKDASDGEARRKYLRQLELMHGITVAAMKCKQTTDLTHVQSLRRLGMAFSETYFSKEDLEHIKSHHDH